MRQSSTIPIDKGQWNASALIISLCAHALLFVYIQQERPLAALIPSHREPIQVQIISKPPVEAARPPLAKPAPPPRSQTHAARTDASQVVAKKPAQSPTAQTKSYSDLLPRAQDMTAPSQALTSADSASTAGSASTENSEDKAAVGPGGDSHGPYYGKAYQDVMIDSNILQGIFDIPLFMRQQSEKGAVTLKVEPLSDTSLRLILLRGDPYLRALVWECLKNMKATSSLKRIADSTQEKVLTIQLSYASQLSPNPQGPRYQEAIRLDKGKIFIHVTLNKDRTYGPQWGGLSLPDKDAELAIKVDRMRVRALADSKAFQRVLRDETINN